MTVSRQDWQRWARKGTTEQRGYGYGHRKLREQRLLVYRPGDMCAHGGEQMWWWPLSVARRFLDLPHNADRSGYLPGLACRRHNRADGQRMTTAILNAKRGVSVRPWQASRQWLRTATSHLTGRRAAVQPRSFANRADLR